jgi:hypothetical protein
VYQDHQLSKTGTEKRGKQEKKEEKEGKEQEDRTGMRNFPKIDVSR